MNLVENWKQYLQELIDPKSIDVIASFKTKDTLDSDIWDSEDKLKEEITDRLYEIAKNFFKRLELDWVDIHDIIFTGSLANYNWSKYSDIDLHILIDYGQVDENLKLVKDFLRKSSSAWNRSHKITIKDYEVEVYVQDINEAHHSTGVYSIKNDEWLVQPSKEFPMIDYESIQQKTATLMDEIDEVYNLFIDKHYKEALRLSEVLKEKIIKFRRSGLETGGEFSIENLTFKALRRNEYLKKLSSLRIISYDKLMTINGE